MGFLFISCHLFSEADWQRSDQQSARLWQMLVRQYEFSSVDNKSNESLLRNYSTLALHSYTNWPSVVTFLGRFSSLTTVHTSVRQLLPMHLWWKKFESLKISHKMRMQLSGETCRSEQMDSLWFCATSFERIVQHLDPADPYSIESNHILVRSVLSMGPTCSGKWTYFLENWNDPISWTN